MILVVHLNKKSACFVKSDDGILKQKPGQKLKEGNKLEKADYILIKNALWLWKQSISIYKKKITKKRLYRKKDFS